MIQQPWQLTNPVRLQFISFNLFIILLSSALVISDLYPRTLENIKDGIENPNKMFTLPKPSFRNQLGYVDNTASFAPKPLLGLDYVKIIRNQPIRYQSFFNKVIRRQRSVDNTTTTTTCVPLQSPAVLKNINGSTKANGGPSPAAGMLLKEVLQEIAYMKAASSGTPDIQCSYNGSWVSEVGGIGMNLEPVENNMIKIHLFETMPPSHGFLNTNWSFEGKAPFKRHGPFLLYGSNEYNNTIAAFTGQCRTCSGLESIIGAWTVTRLAKNCHDVQIATEHRNDLLHKEALHSFHSSFKVNVTTKATNSSGVKGNGNDTTSKSSGKRDSVKESSWMNP